MLGRGLAFICLLAATVFTYAGCRSCSSCHDCDPPVANCDAGGCGCHRAGSVSGHYPVGEYAGEEYGLQAPQAVDAPERAIETPMEAPIEAPLTDDAGALP